MHIFNPNPLTKIELAALELFKALNAENDERVSKALDSLDQEFANRGVSASSEEGTQSPNCPDSQEACGLSA